MTTVANLSVYKGDSESITGTVTDDAGTALNIQVSHLVFTVKKYERDTDTVLVKDSDNVGEIDILDDGSPSLTGQYRVNILPADFRNVTAGFYVYSLRDTTAPEIQSKTVATGTFRVYEDVTDG